MFDGLVVMPGGHCTHPTRGPAIRLKHKKKKPMLSHQANISEINYNIKKHLQIIYSDILQIQIIK